MLVKRASLSVVYIPNWSNFCCPNNGRKGSKPDWQNWADFGCWCKSLLTSCFTSYSCFVEPVSAFPEGREVVAVGLLPDEHVAARVAGRARPTPIGGDETRWLEWSNPSSLKSYGESRLAPGRSLRRHNVAICLKVQTFWLVKLLGSDLFWVLIGCSDSNNSDRIRVVAIKAEVLPVRVQSWFERQ
jgi:hypothetical protein